MSTRYKIRQKMFSIGDDFWIENQGGEKVYKADGKILRIRKTLVFEDAQGKKLGQIQQRLLTIRDTMAVEGPDGKEIAVIKKALIAPFRDRWSVKVHGGEIFEAAAFLPDLGDIRREDFQKRSALPFVKLD